MKKIIFIFGMGFLQFVIAVGAIILFLSFDFVPVAEVNPINGADSISLANTFIVFVTFIVVVGTLIITIVGIYYTQWFAKQKDEIIKDNADELYEAIIKNQVLMDKLFDKIIKNRKVSDIIDTKLDKLAESTREDFSNELKEIQNKQFDQIENIENRILSKLKSSSEDYKTSQELQNIFKGLKHE